MSATKTVSRSRPLTTMDWAVYVLDEKGDPTKIFWTYPSRSAARKERDAMNATAGYVRCGVFRRQVTVTRD